MGKFVASLVVWFIFLGLSTVLVYFGVNYLTNYTITFGNAFGIGLVVRFLFSLNKFYADLEEECGI